MNHIHHNSITSTQDELIQNHSPVQEGTLISADYQSLGKAQHGRSWVSFSGSLAMSFGLAPNENITLTALEVPALIASYFKDFYHEKLFLKWPNDLLNAKGQKCGGILIHRTGNDDFAVGVGINLNPIQTDQEFRFPAGSLFETPRELEIKKLALDIYQFILSHRLSEVDIVEQWGFNCIHKGKPVKIVDGNKTIVGMFLGIGARGQALVYEKDTNLTHECFTGTLFL